MNICDFPGELGHQIFLGIMKKIVLFDEKLFDITAQIKLIWSPIGCEIGSYPQIVHYVSPN